MIGSHELTFRIPVNWLVAVVVLAAALIASYVLASPTTRPLIAFSAAVIAGTAALLTAINAVDARVSQTRLARTMNALDLGHRWTSPEFFHSRKNGRDILLYFKAHTDLAEQKTHLADSAKLQNLFDVLNAFETLSVAIQKDIADEEIAKKLFHSVVAEYWHTAEAFVKSRRAERANTRLLAEVEWLFKRWNP